MKELLPRELFARNPEVFRMIRKNMQRMPSVALQQGRKNALVCRTSLDCVNRALTSLQHDSDEKMAEGTHSLFQKARAFLDSLAVQVLAGLIVAALLAIVARSGWLVVRMPPPEVLRVDTEPCPADRPTFLG
jgi:hypothetical protein